MKIQRGRLVLADRRVDGVSHLRLNRTRGLVLVICALSSVLPGCSREWYRDQADQDVACLIEEKAAPRWGVPFQSVEMDPRSRFHDPYNKVHPPMPTDDPVSHELMHCIDDKEGWDHWHDNGDISDLENPAWQEMLGQYVPLDEGGSVVLSLEDSIRLARIHSPNWQSQVETLYLSALDVSTERFRLDTQFFGGAGTGSGGRTFFNATDVELSGSKSPGGSSFDVGTETDIRLRRRLATAGELVVGFANSFVWTFSGGDTNFAMSAVNFSLVQPLLRAGGRQIALETLTIAERTLLANMRSFEHFRQGFYTQIAIGQNGTTRPSRRGGFSGASGLSGFSGQGAGGFGGVGDATGFGGGGGGGAGGAGGAGVTGSGFAGGGAGSVGGFIGLLQANQQIRNTESSLAAQQQTLQLLEAHLDAGLIDIAQVDQFRQSIETERANLLQSRNGLQNQLDGFKTGTLGLPPDLPIVLDESLIQPFRLLDPGIAEIQADLGTLIDDFGELAAEPTVPELQAILQRQQALAARINVQLAEARREIERLDETNRIRFQTMTPTEQRLLTRDIQRLHNNRDQLEHSFEKTSAALQVRIDGLQEANRGESADAIVAMNVAMTNLLSELTLIEARARLEAISIERIELSPKEALEIARTNRLDWMNNRAALVDTWRLIEFNANRLESNLDVVLNGEMGTVGDNAAKFRPRDSTVSAGLRFDAPFNRRVERNDFRQQLIFYQQARRQMIQYEDGVNRGLRALLRELEQLAVNLEIQRRAVAIAIRRVDQTRENFNRPTPPAEPGQQQTQFGPTAALNLLTALSDLRSSQNNFMSVWLNYQAGRMRLLRDLGIIQIDDEGIWVEQSVQTAIQEAMSGVPMELPPDVPDQWYQELETAPQPDFPPYREENGTGSDGQSGAAAGLKEPVPGPAAEVSQVDRNNLDTARVGLVERLLGSRFARLFGDRKAQPAEPFEAAAPTAERSFTRVPGSHVTAERHRSRSVASRPARSFQKPTVDASTPERIDPLSEVEVITSDVNNDSQSTELQARTGVIRPASFAPAEPARRSAPPALSAPSTQTKSIPASGWTASPNAANNSPVIHQRGSSQPQNITSNRGKWQQTVK